MAIRVVCECGRAVRVREELAGRKVRCPACGGSLPVPLPEGGAGKDDEALDILLADAPADRPAARPPRGEDEAPPPDDAGAIREPPPRRPARRPGFTAEEFAAHSRPRPRRRRSAGSGGFGFAINGEIIAGLLMMGGAALWFILGLAAGRIFIYPPILFVLGLLALFRGFKGEA
jgi:hypothetical protein